MSWWIHSFTGPDFEQIEQRLQHVAHVAALRLRLRRCEHGARDLLAEIRGESEFSQVTGLYEKFDPTQFDADAWVRIAVQAGTKYLVITTKHHDRFWLWPSKYTTYHIQIHLFVMDWLRKGPLLLPAPRAHAALHRHAGRGGVPAVLQTDRYGDIDST